MKHIHTHTDEWETAPAGIFFNHGKFLSGTFTRDHVHSWGQLLLVKGGIVEVRVGNARYLSPSQFAIWIPPGIGHTSYMRRSVSYCSVNISRERAELFPERPCLIEVSDLTSAIAETIKHNGITIPETEQDIRLAEVMFDQLLAAKQHSRFIPSTTDTLIQPIIDAFEKDPADAMTLTEWANKLHTTERTLARHCLSELGMSFTEWRSRVRFVHALTLLKQGKQVKEVALSLGYNQSSPFITMFKKHANCTPEQYRQQSALSR